jgi:hypothetical protein
VASAAGTAASSTAIAIVIITVSNPIAQRPKVMHREGEGSRHDG